MRDAPAGLLPDFLCRGEVVRLPIGRIAVLVRVKVFFRLGRNYLMNPPNRSVRAFVTRCDDKLSAKRTEDAFALMRSAVRQAKFHRIAKRRADRGVGNPRIAAGGINDGLARAESTASEAPLNHTQSRTVLDGSSRIEPLRLGKEFHIRELAADRRQAQQRSVADQIEHTLPIPAMRLLYLHRRPFLRSGDGVNSGHALKSPVSLQDMRPVYSELDATRQFD